MQMRYHGNHQHVEALTWLYNPSHLVKGSESLARKYYGIV